MCVLFVLLFDTREVGLQIRVFIMRWGFWQHRCWCCLWTSDSWRLFVFQGRLPWTPGQGVPGRTHPGGNCPLTTPRWDGSTPRLTAEQVSRLLLLLHARLLRRPRRLFLTGIPRPRAPLCSNCSRECLPLLFPRCRHRPGGRRLLLGNRWLFRTTLRWELKLFEFKTNHRLKGGIFFLYWSHIELIPVRLRWRWRSWWRLVQSNGRWEFTIWRNVFLYYRNYVVYFGKLMSYGWLYLNYLNSVNSLHDIS